MEICRRRRGSCRSGRERSRRDRYQSSDSHEVAWVGRFSGRCERADPDPDPELELVSILVVVTVSKSDPDNESLAFGGAHAVAVPDALAPRRGHATIA